MTTRTERLKKLLELDNKQAMHMANDFYPGPHNHNVRVVFIDGVMNQHAKTRAVFEALVSALGEARGLINAHETAIRHDGGNTNIAVFENRLASIDKILEGDGT